MAGRFAHGWLLCGPRGIGKATLAFRLARSLLARPGEAERCHDPSAAGFRMVAQHAHPDLRVLQREIDARSKRLRKEILVDQVRSAGESLRTTAAFGGARVLIVDAADELNTEAANALLKLLEEPPAGVFMLLVAHRPGLLPRTLVSRCALLRLQPLPEIEFRRGLAALRPELESELIERLSVLARGSLGRAVELVETDWLEAYAGLLRHLTEGDGLGQRLAAAELLGSRAQKLGADAAADLLRVLLRRCAHQLAGRSQSPELVAGEALALERLGRRLGLDRVLGLWDKLGALVSRIEALNLDPMQSFLQAVEAVIADQATDPALAER
jgi:DNA polymerase III subunit delta'